ncbi:hypothetical protein CTAM01_16828 [Colletotrichum tamarilloi]|uniref:Secreted protein n=1 Tax=Colletotrichum tamarilloi TaxID=1209934 RepID=A0ABQ9QHG1_9PEZI|nr:uncharacterized protein CTAM01_16828 [Colletotrichum tamarilloi]KAK1470412.1 hypothetical protein CTAM01_16828 [Colletotrichum tamarilloi]
MHFHRQQQQVKRFHVTRVLALLSMLLLAMKNIQSQTGTLLEFSHDSSVPYSPSLSGWRSQPCITVLETKMSFRSYLLATDRKANCVFRIRSLHVGKIFRFNDSAGHAMAASVVRV